MIVLDTNIISALMQPVPHADVVTWLNQQTLSDLYLPTIVIAEIRYGLSRMPVGQRRQLLTKHFSALLENLFDGHILAFGQQEADVYGVVRAKRESLGLPMSMADAQIAAIVQVKGGVLATRNIKDFEACGLILINPFDVKD